MAIAGGEEVGTVGVGTPAAIVTVAIGGLVAIGDFFIQSHHDSYHDQSSSEKPQGSNNPTTKKAAETGQEAHRQEQKKLVDEHGAKKEVPMQLPDGTNVRKDAVMPDGTAVIIKPNTPSGEKSAKKRAELMERNGVKTETKTYDPTDKKYQPGSPSYIGPKKTN